MLFIWSTALGFLLFGSRKKHNEDLYVPPSNRLHGLKGDRKGRYSISINDQWRICFKFIDGDAYDVEIVDYH
ncbi:MAG: type II toxin-antitoxin system RelE/ParE family toxin [Desulfobacterales bacterium]|nr:type II toxin-antitoxin system RelE/ParE family toxin [Desulfobacterales bacterium]